MVQRHYVGRRLPVAMQRMDRVRGIELHNRLLATVSIFLWLADETSVDPRYQCRLQLRAMVAHQRANKNKLSAIPPWANSSFVRSVMRPINLYFIAISRTFSPRLLVYLVKCLSCRTLATFTHLLHNSCLNTLVLWHPYECLYGKYDLKV